MPHLEYRHFTPQIIVSIFILIITYATINKCYFKQYLSILNNRNKFLTFYKNLSQNKYDKIKIYKKNIKEKLEIFLKQKKEINNTKKERCYYYSTNDKNIICNYISRINNQQKKSIKRLNLLTNKFYHEYNKKVKEYIYLVLNKKK